MSAGKPQALIFDFDGTLVDSYAGITATVNYVRVSRDLPPLTEADIRPHVGRGTVHLLARTVPAGDPEANLAIYKAQHPAVMCAGTRLFCGVAETLAKLQSHGYRMAVCSNKIRDFTRQIADHLGIGRYFDVIIGPEDAPRPKPAPDMLIEAMRRLGAPPPESLYVGDMTVDIQTARGAGVTVWAVPSGSETREQLATARPDRLLNDFRELAPLLLGE